MVVGISVSSELLGLVARILPELTKVYYILDRLGYNISMIGLCIERSAKTIERHGCTSTNYTLCLEEILNRLEPCYTKHMRTVVTIATQQIMQLSTIMTPLGPVSYRSYVGYPWIRSVTGGEPLDAVVEREVLSRLVTVDAIIRFIVSVANMKAKIRTGPMLSAYEETFKTLKEYMDNILANSGITIVSETSYLSSGVLKILLNEANTHAADARMKVEQLAAGVYKLIAELQSKTQILK